MENKKLVLGVLAGAILGGLATLFDRETRTTTKMQYLQAKRKSNYYLKHPSEAVRRARIACNQFNDSFNTGADNAINALEQVEQTIDKLTKKGENEPQRIESVN